MKNIVETTNSYIDKLRVNNETDLSVKYLSDHYSSWVERQLILADYQIRNIMLHLFATQDGAVEVIYSDDSKIVDLDDSNNLVYDIVPTHPLQTKILPQLIEEALMSIISDKWCEENQITPLGKSNLTLAELKSISLRREPSRGLKYRIIY